MTKCDKCGREVRNWIKISTKAENFIEERKAPVMEMYNGTKCYCLKCYIPWLDVQCEKSLAS